MDRVAVALGSNLGDRRTHLDFAVSRLRDLLSDLRVSSYHETDPVDAPDPQPRYFNAAAVGLSPLAPRALLDALLSIEQERGRTRDGVNAARTLDLDLILFGNRMVDEQSLVVPHPRFRERRFVLGPLSEVAPDFVDPVTGLSVAELLHRLPDRLR